MQQEIKQWGNSAAVRLSRKILAKANLDIASRVRIEVREGRIIIEPVTQKTERVKLPFSENDLLENLTPETAHADEVAIPGDEEWGD